MQDTNVPQVLPQAADFCPRQIIFELAGSPGVLITATETGTGAIDFIVDVEDTPVTTADLRALFFHFNESKLGGLQITGGDGLLTERRIGLNNVLDLGDGATLAGAVKTGFDIGLEWGTAGGKKDDISFPVHFTLSRSANDLTLDDFATLQFGAKLDSVGGPGGPRGGASKLVGVAPYAPDASDDTLSIFEDGATNLDSPSKTSTAVALNVLTNDIDKDGDSLTITGFHDGPSHGSVAISADGKSVLYTPHVDYAGTDSFEYCVSDGHGGQDSAVCTVTIVPVADDPLISWTVAQGADVNQILITVTATQNDADGSEYVDDIVATMNPLLGSVTIVPGFINPAGTPAQIIQQFVVNTAPMTDYDFNIDFTATAIEKVGGDQEDATGTQNIRIDYNTETQHGQFDATDQSIWSNGDAFTASFDRFIGIDTGRFDESIDGPFGTSVGLAGELKVGIHSILDFNGGEIDATADYDLTVETTYNRTTNFLHIDTGALLTDAAFTTQGPEGRFLLDFIYAIELRAYAAIDITILEVGIDEDITLYGLDRHADIIPLLRLDSSAPPDTFVLPDPLDAFSVTYGWPHLSTVGGFPLPVDSSGASNNFFQLNLDLDQAVSNILFGGFNPFDPPRIDAGPFFADAEILGIDLHAGFNFLQDFLLTMGSLVGTLNFENGSSMAFTFGDELDIPNASLIDAGGDHDGLVEFTFQVGPQASLTNDTRLGFNVGVDVRLLSVEVGYDIEIDSDSTTLGPLATFGVSRPVADFSIFDDTFALGFSSHTFSFHA